jgi:hypothetical protein
LFGASCTDWPSALAGARVERIVAVVWAVVLAARKLMTAGERVVDCVELVGRGVLGVLQRPGVQLARAA